MDLHGNAALSWSGRRELARRVVEQGWTLTAAAEAAGVSVRCARKWVGRYREGDRQLLDRSSAPRRVANRTDPARVAVIVKLRRLRMTAAEIAQTLGMPLSTVSGILTRLSVGRLGRLGLEPAVRYERSRPGELVHIDVKKLGRIVGGAGWRVRGGRQHRNPVITDAAGKPFQGARGSPKGAAGGRAINPEPPHTAPLRNVSEPRSEPQKWPISRKNIEHPRFLFWAPSRAVLPASVTPVTPVEEGAYAL
jgi:hypothetical protein